MDKVLESTTDKVSAFTEALDTDHGRGHWRDHEIGLLNGRAGELKSSTHLNIKNSTYIPFFNSLALKLQANFEARLSQLSTLELILNPKSVLRRQMSLLTKTVLGGFQLNIYSIFEIGLRQLEEIL
jgi:hypothetical protein